MIRQAYRGLASFARRDVVLTTAILLAVLSAFFVPPSPAYLSYIDWDTLCLLFSLMAVMKGFQQEGFFQSMGSALLRRAASTRRMVLVLVFLPFFCSMAITNDVSLITFVPFGLAVLKLAQQEELAVPLVALQTLAANLGSMLTPMGNPQNLYLYSRSGMGFGELCAVMLPYVLLSGICLLGLSVLRSSHPNAPPRVNTRRTNPRRLGMWGVWFLLCLLGLFGAVPSWAVAALVLIFLSLRERPVLRAVDYSCWGPLRPSSSLSATFRRSLGSSSFCLPFSKEGKCWFQCWSARLSAMCPLPCCSRALQRIGPACSSDATWVGWVR